MYDAAHPVTISGTVAEFSFRNPHCFLYIDVDAGPYRGRRYVVEMSSAGVLGNSGWTASTLAAGAAVRVTVLPARTGKAAGLCRDQCATALYHSVAK
jgi:hypothetical protein